MQILQVRFSVPNEKRFDVIQTIQTVIEPTLAITACSNCGLYSDVMNDDVLVFLEEWNSQKALLKHLRSSEFNKVLICLDLATDKPDFFIYRAEKNEGLEFVEKAFEKTK